MGDIPLSPFGFQHSEYGVIFGFSGASQPGGYHVPWVFRLVGGSQPDMHWMENDQTSGGAKLIGVIRIDFIEGVATPPEVRFLLRFPPALDPIGIEAYGASGQQLPVSAIERANPRSWGALDLLDVTIRWTGGMREISLLTTYEDVQ